MAYLIKKDRGPLVDAAMGRIPCSLAIENVQLVNVFTGEIYWACVDVFDGIIVGIRKKDEESTIAAECVIDGEGMYLIPGFVDTHVHVESSLLIPESFGKAAVTWGTTLAFTDPHEIANVVGTKGVEFMIESARRSPLRQFNMVPSCVPALPGYETSGAEIFAEDVEKLLAQDGVYGIAEIMDYVGVINNEKRIKNIIQAGDDNGAFLQGHAPGVSGKELCAYLVGGPVSDHECTVGKNLLEKRRLGMHIDARIHSLEEAKELIKGIGPGNFKDTVSLCTDDVNAYRLLSKGHVNRAAADLVEAGMPPIDVLRLGTLNGAREFGFSDVGAIAPGYVADMQLVKDLTFKEKPAMVLVGGKVVAKDGKYIGDKECTVPTEMINTINIKDDLTPDDFRIPAPDRDEIGVMVVNEGYEDELVVRKSLDVKDGYGKINDEEMGRLNYICVMNRYGKNNKTLALYSGFGLKTGAIVSSIGHDSHNLFIVYADPEDACLAVKTIENCGGGVCYVSGREVRALLRLPIGGLMSNLPLEETAAECENVEKTIAAECGRENFTLSDLIFETLPVIKRYTPTDLGVVDGDKKKFIEIYR